MSIFSSWSNKEVTPVVREVTANEAYKIWANDERLTGYAQDLAAQLSYARIQGPDLDAARTRLGTVLLEKGLRLSDENLDKFAQLMLEMA
jgi:hypothetical protein